MRDVIGPARHKDYANAWTEAKIYHATPAQPDMPCVPRRPNPEWHGARKDRVMPSRHGPGPTSGIQL